MLAIHFMCCDFGFTRRWRLRPRCPLDWL